MYSFIGILSQLAWAVTVGGLTAAVTALSKVVAVGGVLGGGGYWLWRRWRGRARVR